MQLKDISNMDYYLDNECYCPGEIYDVTGFFFRVFHPDDECVLITEGVSKSGDKVTCVVVDDQLINFWISEHKGIIGAERYDATDNNIELMKRLWKGESLEWIEIDEFEKGHTKKMLNEIKHFADAILI